jgi:hypothetical protein
MKGIDLLKSFERLRPNHSGFSHSCLVSVSAVIVSRLTDTTSLPRTTTTPISFPSYNRLPQQCRLDLLISQKTSLTKCQVKSLHRICESWLSALHSSLVREPSLVLLISFMRALQNENGVKVKFVDPLASQITVPDIPRFHEGNWRADIINAEYDVYVGMRQKRLDFLDSGSVSKE